MTNWNEQARLLLEQLVREHTGAAGAVRLEPVAAGASGRCIMRAGSLLGICWNAARADNNSFLPAAHGLAAAGIRVPAVLAERDFGGGTGACLVQDLGHTDLLSLRDAPRAERLRAYTEALKTLRPFYDELQPTWELQPAFDAALYRWEQEYFAEHFVGRQAGGSAAVFLGCPALQEMADWLASLPRVPVHRDCQSQNIMLSGGRAWLIDFQGMRYGREEYDLASLLYDPYMALPGEERAELLAVRESLGAPPLNADVFAACAMQRLMQALGAFANIGYNQQRDWYKKMIPVGVAALQEVVTGIEQRGGMPVLTSVASWLRRVIGR